MIKNNQKVSDVVQKGIEFFDHGFRLVFNFGTGLFIGIIFSLNIPYDWDYAKYNYVDHYLSKNCTKYMFLKLDTNVCVYNFKQCTQVGGFMNNDDECIRNVIKDAVLKWKCTIKGGEWIELHGCQPKNENPKEDL